MATPRHPIRLANTIVRKDSGKTAKSVRTKKNASAWLMFPPKKMNAKEAREIIKAGWIGGDDEDYGDFCLAKGYLEALKGPEVLALLDALRKVVFRDEDDAGICEKALAKFREAVNTTNRSIETTDKNVGEEK